MVVVFGVPSSSPLVEDLYIWAIKNCTELKKRTASMHCSATAGACAGKNNTGRAWAAGALTGGKTTSNIFSFVYPASLYVYFWGEMYGSSNSWVTNENGIIIACERILVQIISFKMKHHHPTFLCSSKNLNLLLQEMKVLQQTFERFCCNRLEKSGKGTEQKVIKADKYCSENRDLLWKHLALDTVFVQIARP